VAAAAPVVVVAAAVEQGAVVAPVVVAAATVEQEAVVEQAAVREPVAVMAGAILMPVHTVRLTRCGLGLPLIRSTNWRISTGGVGRGTRRPCSTGFTKLGG
jgi:hypothetical protein